MTGRASPQRIRQRYGDTSMAGAGDEGAEGVAAPAIALGAWILLTPAMFSGTVLAACALARRCMPRG